MADVAIGSNKSVPAPAPKAVAPSRPTEGWFTFALHLVIIAMTASSVVRVDRDDRSAILIPLAAGGLLLGGLVARTPALDAVAHILALVSGAMSALLLFALKTDGLSKTWDARGRNVYDLGQKIVDAQLNVGTTRLTDDDLLVVIGVTLWLVGYSSAWMLYRRHWLTPALLVPAVLVFINLRFEDEEPTVSLAVFTVAALVMAARHQAFVRQIEWSRARVPVPRGLPARFTASGSVIAVIALVLGWALPVQAPNGIVDGVADQFQTRWEQVARELNKIGGPSQRNQFASNDYSTFADSFKIGGEFTPSEDPVASLEASESMYLVLRRYDQYNGLGWASAVDSTYQMAGGDSDEKAASVTFVDNQNVALSTAITGDRRREAGVITVLKDKGGLLFTTETFVSASIPTVAVLGWKQIATQEINVESVDIGSLPVDLQGLVNVLRGSEFKIDPATGLPVVVDQAAAQLIEQERTRLRTKYPVETELSFGEGGRIVLTVTGRIPNYDDIEAVFANLPGGLPGRYRVIGMENIANEDQLRDAGMEYPDWVLQRYLQLPETITAETVRLAADIVAGEAASTPFDKAWAIQEYLHNSFQYAENSEPTPSDRDAVDFFLFDKKVGRCEEYATSMVVMLRTQGVPARLVAGYRAGDETNAFGDYIYREKQAHTWVEVYFPGYGWIPFEPTRGQAPFDYNGGETLLEPTASPTDPFDLEPTPSPEPEIVPEATPTPALVAANTNDGDDTSLSERLTSKLGIVSLALTGLAALVVAGFVVGWVWGLRGLRPGAALFARTIRIGKFWGIEPNPTMTPREYAAEFGQVVPRAGVAARYVAELYSAEQYGGVEISEEAQHGGRQAWKAVRSGMLSWRPWRRQKRGGR